MVSKGFFTIPVESDYRPKLRRIFEKEEKQNVRKMFDRKNGDVLGRGRSKQTTRVLIRSLCRSLKVLKKKRSLAKFRIDAADDQLPEVEI